MKARKSGSAPGSGRRIAAGLLALGFLVALGCRKPTPPPAPELTRRLAVESDDPGREARLTTGHKKVIVIGLDGADWSLLDRLMASGGMPNLQKMTAEGRSARLRSFLPTLSPVVWTTIATGADPERHGVLDFQEVERESGALVPVSGKSRRVPAFWNVASGAGLKVGVVGWWGTHPAEEVDGFFVSDRVSSILFDDAPKEGMTFPAALSEGVRRLSDQERRLDSSDLAPFFRMTPQEISAVRGEGGGLENRVVAMERILVATRIGQRIARTLYDRERPDLLAAYFEGTDAVGHVFASYVPPRLTCTSEADFRRYSGTVDATYALFDRLLGQWMRRAREDGATLLLCSDHGFKWDEDRTCQRASLNWSTAAFWHRLNGVLVLWGDRVKPSTERGEASVFDIAPTVLALLGLPVDPKMTGRPLVSFLQGVAAPAKEDLFGRIQVGRVAAIAPTAAERSEYAEKLRSLGYLTGSEAKALPVEKGGAWPGWTEGAWNNLGLFQREAGRLGEAERSFRESLRLRPGYSSPMFNLAVLERSRGRWDQALDWLFQSLEKGHAEPEETILQWVGSAKAASRPRVALRLLEEGTKRYPASEKLAIVHARLRLDAKDCAGARAALEAFAEKGGRDALNLLGLAEMCLEHPAEAQKYLRRSLALDPAQPPIQEALRFLGEAP